MDKIEIFKEQEIPYDILQQLGLTQEMMDDLPEHVKNRLLSGRTTPVMPVITENEDGELIRSMAQIALVRKMDRNVDVMLMPAWDAYDLSEFEEEEQRAVLAGRVTTADVAGKGRCYIQFDDSINQVMFVPVGIINKNISTLANTYGWHELDDIAMKDGDIVLVEVNNKTFSVGIDLNAPTAIRIVHGNEMNWKEDIKAERMPSYSFGLYGCWISDDYGHMTYVAEEDYDETILNEQKRTAQQNVTASRFQQMR